MADYIDRNEAIAALRKFAEECKGSTEAATAAAMGISVISRLPGPWVDVNIEPPTEGKRVLTYCKYGRMRDRVLNTLPLRKRTGCKGIFHAIPAIRNLNGGD